MKRFVVMATKHFEIIVEAENEDEAYDAAFSVPLDQWRDEHEMAVEIEPLAEDA
jgi:hypothetical protein